MLHLVAFCRLSSLTGEVLTTTKSTVEENTEDEEASSTNCYKCWPGIRLESRLILILELKEMRKSWPSVIVFRAPFDVKMRCRPEHEEWPNECKCPRFPWCNSPSYNDSYTPQPLQYLLQCVLKTRSASTCSDHWNIFKYESCRVVLRSGISVWI